MLFHCDLPQQLCFIQSYFSLIATIRIKLKRVVADMKCFWAVSIMSTGDYVGVFGLTEKSTTVNHPDL